MIFAAGLGTRLKPLTNKMPKALVPFQGKPLLRHAIEYLSGFGVQSFVINVHHFADQIINYLSSENFSEFEIVISDERTKLLDTGGALLKASSLLDSNEPFILYNADVITNLNLSEMMDWHRQKGGLASLAVRKRVSSRYLLMDGDNSLVGWRNVKSGKSIMAREVLNFSDRAFSGIHIVEPKLLRMLEDRGAFPIIPAYLKLASTQPILCYDHSDGYWFDMGKAESFEAAKEKLNSEGK